MSHDPSRGDVYGRDWRAIATIIALPTSVGAGVGGAASLLAKPKKPEKYVKTGLVTGAVIGVIATGALGAFQERWMDANPPTKPVGTSGVARMPVRFP